jgi:hypothetical protein
MIKKYDIFLNEKGSVPSYTPKRKTTDDIEILEHIENHTQRMGHHEDDYEGYLVTTNKRTIKFLILAEQDCCEDWGYFMSEDNFEDFYGSQIFSVEVVDDALKSTELHLNHIEEQHDDDRGTQTMFVNFNTSEGLLQFVAYNNHNGYYGHTAYFIVDDNIEEEKRL